MHREQTDVLIVGAGPVGMVAALFLHKLGIRTKLIDQSSRIASHSYACALHPYSLQLLNELGIAATVIKHGRSLEKAAFYEGVVRKGELWFTDLPLEYPFLLVLPQNALELALEEELALQANERIFWNHRLAQLHMHKDEVITTVEKLSESDNGHATSEWDSTILKEFEVSSRYLIGCDGQDSSVRRKLHIPFDLIGQGEGYVIYEFETDITLPHEVRVVFYNSTANVMWPLSDHRVRWSFQVLPSDVLGEQKSRGRITIRDRHVEEAMRAHATRLLEQRAPWFHGNIKEIEWWTGAHFERRVAQRFGMGRCCLAGDAAHRTGPIGMQSMNVGLREVKDLAHMIAQGLSAGSKVDPEAYHSKYSREWTRLLRAYNGEKITADWAASYRDRLISCIPASGDQLTYLLNQAGLSHSMSSTAAP